VTEDKKTGLLFILFKLIGFLAILTSKNYPQGSLWFVNRFIKQA
jgi:hypothetical protein